MDCGTPTPGWVSALQMTLFVALSVVAAVAAHRRVRNVLLACAGAAGVATGSYLVLGTIVEGKVDKFIGVAFFFGVLLSGGIALATWVVMKLTGRLPKAPR